MEQAPATDSSGGSGGGSGSSRSGYTPFDDLQGGIATSYASCISNDKENDDESAEGTDQDESEQSTTFILASHVKPYEEPDGWSDYSKDDCDDDSNDSAADVENMKNTTDDGAFFADMSAFGPNGTCDDNVDDTRNEDSDNGERDIDTDAIIAEGYAPLSAIGAPDDVEEDDENNCKDDEVDFRAIADQALRALDDDYLSTVQLQQQQQQQQQQSAASRFMATIDEGCDNNINDTPTSVQAIGPADISSSDENTKDSESEMSRGEQNDEEKPISPRQYTSKKELPPIDGDAVRRAVASMRFKSPNVAANLDAGAELRLDPKYRLSLAPTLVPSTHAIIPSAPLAAFRRATPKAVTATANLSRSATISEALVRCLPHLLLPRSRINSSSGSTTEKSTLKMHIVGCDHIECESNETVRAVFGPLIRWMGAACSSQLSNVNIALLGPNVPLAAEGRGPLSLLPYSDSGDVGLKSVTVSSINCLYHDYLQEQGNTADIVVAFNAGIWGYDEWRPTLEALCEQEKPVPFIITGYTVQESEDDAEVVAEVAGASALAVQMVREVQSTEEAAEGDSLCGSKGKCLWEAEVNPYGSRKKRDTSSAIVGREYRENGAWQGWLLGGTKA